MAWAEPSVPGMVLTRADGQPTFGTGRKGGNGQVFFRCGRTGQGIGAEIFPGGRLHPGASATREERAAKPTQSRKCFTNNKPQLLLIDRNSTNFKFSCILLFSETPKKAPPSGSYIVNSCREKGALRASLAGSTEPHSPASGTQRNQVPRLQGGGMSLCSWP